MSNETFAEALVEARLRLRAPEPVTRVWPALRWSIMEVNANRGCRRTAAQQARPGAEIRKIEKAVGAAEPDLPGQDRCVLGARAAGDDRPGIAEYGGA